ncbi:hypothetical protein ACU684_09440 [Pseudomonas sp. LF135]
MEDVRFKYHELLVELDAATSKMMMLVSAGQMTGPEWLESAQKHHYAYEAWKDFLRTAPSASESRH